MMQVPANSGSNFYNYKGTFSIILLAVCDAQYCFTLLDIGDIGRQSDGGVLANSAFGQSLESGSFLCLALSRFLVSHVQYHVILLMTQHFH